MSQERQETTEKLHKEMNELFKKYLQEMTSFREEQSLVLAMAEKMKTIAIPKEKIVKLDIGGQIFSTTIDVLTSEKDTFFTGMFSEQFLQKPSEEGTYFIDRDPTYFRFILNYLRYGKNMPFKLEAFDSFQLEEFKFEVEFYQIGSLLDLINKSHSLFHCDFAWSNGSKEFQLNSTGWQMMMGTELTEKRIYTWSIKLKKLLQTGNSWMIIIGVARKSHANTYLGGGVDGWGYVANGLKNHHSGSGATYSEKYLEGDTITCVLDLEKGALSFKRNGKDLGVAFTNVTAPVCIACSVSANVHLELSDQDKAM